MRKVPNIIKALKRLMLVIIAFAGLIIGITHAQANDNRQIGYLQQTSESSFHLTFNNTVKTSFTDGVVTVNYSEGNSEVLPTITRDKNGAIVKIVYSASNDGYDLFVQQVNMDRKKSPKWWKCTLGTVGGGGTGAMGGYKIGVGAGPYGAAVGTIIGAVSGAATGAASACF